LGEIDRLHGDHAKALNRLREARALSERVNGSEFSFNRLVGDVLIAQAKVYGDMGAYGDALSWLTKAHQVSRSSGDRNLMASIMSSQASILLEQEDYARAQTYFKASIDIYRAARNTREEARVLLQLAIAEQRQGHHDDALLFFQRTMDRANTAKLADLQIAAGGGLADVFTAKRDFPNALKTINQSLEIARRVDAKTREVELLLGAAQTYQEMQSYPEAASLAEQALRSARSLRLPKLTYLATAALGKAYAAEGNVDLAISTLRDAITQVEGLRDEVVAAHEGRQIFFESKVGPYQALVTLLANQGKTFEALLYAERAKGRVLLDAVRNNRTDLQNIYTEGEKAEAESLINKYHGINQRIQAQPSGELNNKLQDELKGIRSELVLFQERLAAAHPELLLRTGSARPLTQASVKNLTSAIDVAYVEYVVTDDKVGIFLVKRTNLTADYELKYVNVSVTADKLRRQVNDFHSALAERRPDYDPLGRELYRLLIAPVANQLQNIRTVCIIPDGILWTLPFQALTTTSGKYFVEEYSLYYAPSLTVLNEMGPRRRQQTSKESILAFGNPVVDKDDKLPQDLHPLPEAQAEVAAVATAIPTRMTKVLVGAEAKEKTFKALAPQYATIHIATHGFLNDRDPLNSFLVLTRTNGDPENDGLLKAREIIEMHLDSDLVVLSACQTGNGRIGAGEGVVGMSWSFLIAGARSVVVSQWRVNSASTAQLMKNFYQALVRHNDPNSRNKSEALREASLRLLKDRRYHHPFYWAGFVLVSSN
jgi:CHAT domain-containing protein